MLDDVIEAELTHWKPLMAPLVQPLLDEIDKAAASGESLESLRARMAQMAARMDTRPLGEAIARAGQKGAVLGAADVNLTQPGV
ncbi:hypothetical protein VITFI_CDS1063 [Vitreoscilla filiformis]|uniref:Uncharacterized protein n=1 Tax=Vitreoscilla filiformis TaxID=63 RepID=A0A221KCU7_VITFI|nr:hypothetical protein VITFI_CDS1063 [Vitreoscilla filiformis]